MQQVNKLCRHICVIQPEKWERSYARHLESAMQWYKKLWNNVFASIGNNCNFNERVENIRFPALIRCANHRYNVPFQDYFKIHEDLLERIRKLFTKLKNGLSAGKLRKHTPLVAGSWDQRRRTFSFKMGKRYVKICEFTSMIDDPIVKDLSLTPRDNLYVEKLLSNMT